MSMKKRKNKLVVISDPYFGDHWVELRSSNGRVLLQSDPYMDIRSVRNIVKILESDNYDIEVDKVNR